LNLKYAAVIFDMDGTLLDSIEDIADAMNLALGRFGFPVHPVERYRTFVGDGMETLAMRALPEDRRSPGNVAVCAEALKEEYSARWSVKTRPFPGIPELLDGLAGIRIKLSILTNKPDAFAKEMARALLGRWTFHEVRGVSKDCPRKPDPCGAVICAERMGVNPASCIFLGDSGVDMETASRSGMAPVGALWGYQDRGQLISGGAKILLRDPKDLLCFVREEADC